MILEVELTRNIDIKNDGVISLIIAIDVALTYCLEQEKTGLL